MTGILSFECRSFSKKRDVLKGAEQLGEGADGWAVLCMNTSKNTEQALSCILFKTQYYHIVFQHVTTNVTKGYLLQCKP